MRDKANETLNKKKIVGEIKTFHSRLVYIKRISEMKHIDNPNRECSILRRVLSYGSIVPSSSEISHQKSIDSSIYSGNIYVIPHYSADMNISKNSTGSLQSLDMSNIPSSEYSRAHSNIYQVNFETGSGLSSNGSFTSLASMRSSVSNDLCDFEIRSDLNTQNSSIS
ncbi:hypothetical protein AYI68_g1456 [Smittium mucronatum]|uniref:Uncharacterized protein n=1 Tax=Smittium mucronatum TaxID=133383 RepID=A0A1R0H5L5_9FUNG|nr:hypothetical protein AYI68_g1456 [Smittium mucronatum]